MLKCVVSLTFALTTFAEPAMAFDRSFSGRPSSAAFRPYHPWHDSAIFFPGRRGPIPVHVRIYSTPVQPPYYNVPSYIVLDP